MVLCGSSLTGAGGPSGGRLGLRVEERVRQSLATQIRRLEGARGGRRARASRLGVAVGLALTVSAAALGGLGGTASATNTRALTTGHHPAHHRTVSVPAADLRISVPNTWARYQMTKQRLSEIVNSLHGNACTEAALSEIEGSLGQSIKFFAIDPVTGQDLLVLVLPVPAGATLSELRSQVTSALQAEGATFYASRTQVARKQAVRIDVSTTGVSTKGHPVTGGQAQFYVLEGSNAVAVDISRASAATIDTIVGSARFTH